MYDKLVVRIGQLLVLISYAIVRGVVSLDLLHVSHNTMDRISFVTLLIFAISRPVGYLTLSNGIKEDKNIEGKDTKNVSRSDLTIGT